MATFPAHLLNRGREQSHLVSSDRPGLAGTSLRCEDPSADAKRTTIYKADAGFAGKVRCG
jgi:hypothetical protein